MVAPPRWEYLKLVENPLKLFKGSRVGCTDKVAAGNTAMIREGRLWKGSFGVLLIKGIHRRGVDLNQCMTWGGSEDWKSGQGPCNININSNRPELGEAEDCFDFGGFGYCENIYASCGNLGLVMDTA